MRKEITALAASGILSLSLFLFPFHLFSLPALSAQEADAVNDPYIWLENVEDEKALDWVRKENAISTKELEALPNFEPIRARLLTILESKQEIPYVSKAGKYYYNFWRDDDHVRGIWRRTSLAEYKKEHPDWELVLDIDKLSADEKENWVYHSSEIIKPDYDLCLISLSRGGKDADVVREFDLTKKEFVKDGFTLPEGKHHISWRDRNSVYVGTDFGPGSLTTSGYPRIIKQWQRGTPLTDARTIIEGKPTDVSVSGSVDHDHGIVYDFVERSPTFFSDELFVRRGDQLVKVDKQDDATFSTLAANAGIRLRSDWKVGEKSYRSGSFLLENFESYMKGKRDLEVLFEPTERKSFGTMGQTKNYLLLTEMDNVRTRPYMLKRQGHDWSRQKLEATDFGDVSVWGIDHDESDDYFMTVSDFLTPTTLYLGTAGKQGREKLKSLPEFFKTDGLHIEQFEATSKDGTRIPYFQVSRKDLKLDGTNPTLQVGYGGFEVANLPGYKSLAGASWMEKGGVYVLANIRGGGEFGPRWHEAARKENRQRAYDDFIAVAEDLIARKVTSPAHLGIQGRSNGGLLMGVMLTQRPDLFAAIHCGSPLLDMRRYNHLLAGASWMDEYGDPDKPEQWAYISKYSPYQNIAKDKKYPPILITTSTRDDRVHPGHARKMVARLKEQGHQVLYYENIEGGHSAASNKKQSAYMEALAYAFLWKHLAN